MLSLNVKGGFYMTKWIANVGINIAALVPSEVLSFNRDLGC